MSAVGESSGSDSDDYLPETSKPTFLRRLSKSKTYMPRYSQSLTKIPKVFFKPRGLSLRLHQSNSETRPLPLSDIRSHPPPRKNSCSCPDCGGSKLSKALSMLLLPKADIITKPRKATNVKSFASMIKDSRKDAAFHIPGMKAMRLSVLIKPAPNVVFVQPPATPALNRLLATGGGGGGGGRGGWGVDGGVGKELEPKQRRRKGWNSAKVAGLPGIRGKLKLARKSETGVFPQKATLKGLVGWRGAAGSDGLPGISRVMGESGLWSSRLEGKGGRTEQGKRVGEERRKWVSIGY